MKTIERLLFYFTFVFVTINSNAQGPWQWIANDDIGDGANASLLDATEFLYYHDTIADSLHFRLVVDVMNSALANDVGVNVMVNIPGEQDPFAFWGGENNDLFHKLMTAWVTGTPPNTYSGTIGMANSTGVTAGNFTNLHSNNMTVEVDLNEQAIMLGMKRTDVISNDMIPGESLDLAVAAAVGSSQYWNDDVYNANLSIEVWKVGAIDTTDTIDPSDTIDMEWPLGVEHQSIQPSLKMHMDDRYLEITGINLSSCVLFDLIGREMKTDLVKADDKRYRLYIFGELSSAVTIVRMRDDQGQVYAQKVFVPME